MLGILNDTVSWTYVMNLEARYEIASLDMKGPMDKMAEMLWKYFIASKLELDDLSQWPGAETRAACRDHGDPCASRGGLVISIEYYNIL